MKKKTLTALALGAATVATGIVSNAHADNVTVTKKQVGGETEVITTTTKTNATQQQINQTKQAVAQQQTVVNEDRSSVASAQSQVNQDVANVASAKSNVNQKSANLSSVQSAVVSAQKNQPTSAAVQQNKADQASMSSKVAQDQSKISSQQAVVQQSSQRQAAAQSKYDQAHSQLVADQKVSSQYQNDQKIATVLANKKQSDQTKINSIQSEFNQTKPLQPSLDLDTDPNNPSDSFQTILKNYVENGEQASYLSSKYSDSPIEDFTGLSAFNNPDFNMHPWLYDINTVNKGVVGILPSDYDAFKTSGETGFDKQQSDIKNDINIYALSLINSIRKQVGLNPLDATDVTVQLANDVAKNYVADQHWPTNYANEEEAHDKNAINNALANYPNVNVNDGYRENLYELGAFPTNMAQLKTAVFEGIAKWISDDNTSNWGHTQNLLDPNAKYIGLSFFKENTDMPFVMNAEIIDSMSNPGKDLSNLSGFNTALQNAENQLQKDSQAYDAVSQRLPQERQAANNLPNDEQQVAAAQQELTNANQALAAANNQLDQLQQQYSADQQKLSQLVDQGKQYQQQLDLLHNTTSLLQNAHDEYNAAVQNYNQAVAKESQDRAMLAQLQHDYDIALNKLNELQAELREEEYTTSTTSVQWIKNPVTTTADLGNVVSLTPSVDNNQSNVVSLTPLVDDSQDNEGSSTPLVGNSQVNAGSNSEVVVKNDHKTTVNSTKVTVNTNTSKKAASVVSEKSNKKTVAVAPHVALQADDANVVHADTVQAVKAAQESANENVISFTTPAPTSVVNASVSASEENSMPQTGETSSSKTSLWGAISLAAAGILSTLGLADRKHRN